MIGGTVRVKTCLVLIVVPRCPSSVVNGLVDDKCLRRVGDSCAVTCDPRYRLKEENKTVMCTTNTTWDDEIPCEGRKLHKIIKVAKILELVQSSTTPDPGYHMGK